MALLFFGEGKQTETQIVGQDRSLTRQQETHEKKPFWLGFQLPVFYAHFGASLTETKKSLSLEAVFDLWQNNKCTNGEMGTHWLNKL